MYGAFVQIIPPSIMIVILLAFLLLRIEDQKQKGGALSWFLLSGTPVNETHVCICPAEKSPGTAKDETRPR